MVASAVPGFLPSVYGLRFANAFPPGPTIRLGPLDPRVIGIGDAASGLCGGMAWTARDLWAAGVAAPPGDGPQGDGPPANGSPRFRALVRRQVQSLDWFRVPLRYLDLQAFRPDPPTGLAALLAREPSRVDAVRREWPRIRASIVAGEPCVVGLVRASGFSPWALTQNHQVLAWGFDAAEADDAITIRVYDPNHPGRDDVELRATIDPEAPGTARPWRERIHLAQSTGEPLLGLFRQPDPGRGSVSAWR
jgi:hypothetical protein